jgi:hypothetical protein
VSDDRTATVKVEITRYRDLRIVATVTTTCGPERMHVSEEFGPFQGISEVMVACDLLVRGYFQGQFVEHLAQRFSAIAADSADRTVLEL